MKKTIHSFLCLLFLLAPYQKTQGFDKDEKELLCLISLYVYTIIGTIKITNYCAERDAKITDTENIDYIKKNIEKYHREFGHMSTTTNLSDIQSFATNNQNRYQELKNYLNQADQFKCFINDRCKQNDSLEMLQAKKDLSAWSSEVALAHTITKQNYLITNKFLNYSITSLKEHIMLRYAKQLQNEQPPSCANRNDPGILEKAVIEIKNDIDFLEKNTENSACSKIAINKLRHCSNILQATPQYQNEKSLQF